MHIPEKGFTYQNILDMNKKLYFILLVFLFSSYHALAQSGSGSLQGKILDKDKKNEPIPFASVVVELNGAQIGGGQSDFDGNYSIKPIPPGKYTIKAQILGYQPIEITGVMISADKITFYDIPMSSTIVKLKEFQKIEYVVPLISKDNTSSGVTVTKEEIRAAPTRNVTTIVANSAGVYQQDEGKDLNVRGTRAEATYVYIDGIKVRVPSSSTTGGSINLPKSSIEQISTITGGLPAQYGDATGGVINITTRGPSSEYSGGAEVLTSQFLDPYGYNLVSVNASGPIYSVMDTTTKSKKSVVGFFFAAEYESIKDPSPSAVGMYKVKDDKLKQIQNTPLVTNPYSSFGSLRSAEYITSKDLEKIDAKQNIPTTAMRLNGKIDFKPSSNTTFTIGGSIDYAKLFNYNYDFSLFNSENNLHEVDNTWRVFGRFTQRFAQGVESEKSASTVKNIFYSVQGDFSRFTETDDDNSHGDKLFNYGYLGKFTTSKDEIFTKKADGKYYLAGYQDVKYDFVPGSLNPLAANYTSAYYNIANDNVYSFQQVQSNGGLLNGDAPQSVYSIYTNTGNQYNSYRKIVQDQFRVSAQGSADIKNHAIIVGMEFEQRFERAFSVAPVGLWSLMRQLANSRNEKLDTLKQIASVTGDTIRYPRQYVADSVFTTGFYENIRTALGKSNTEWLDIDSFSPDKFKLTYFTPDELLNNGSPYVSYYGYDAYGNQLNGKPTLKEFFTKRDANNNYTRELPAFEPTYFAGYIQDKFAFNDLLFNIGLRIDRFDANQPVLKDKYLLYDAHTAQDPEVVALTKGAGVPSNIGSDYTVYVDNYNNPTQILGYRSGDKWYDENGAQITDPGILAKSSQSGEIKPYLLAPEDARGANKSENLWKAFKDYEPQINFMPRIAFSFPISDEALFFAHYDILSQRPSLRSRIVLPQYLFLEQYASSIINNPDLKPEKTTDYELGFKQKLNNSSAISISAFYRELKNQIHAIGVSQAFPFRYNTFGNIDFGTVKGLVISYDLRRSSNVAIKASYQLQFADGTGSGIESGFSTINAGQPNLRTPLPLDFDQRHLLVTSFDFRYESGEDYNGPVWFGKQVFANAGVNLVGRLGSGVPYTKQKNVTPEGQFGVQKQSTLSGSVNGSRYPWQFNVDARIDKDFEFKSGKAGDGQKTYTLNVYLQISNLLNTLNVIGVYKFSGNPDDDGYLASAQAQNTINSQISAKAFTDLYSIKVNNPDNYSMPRRIRLGLAMNF